MSLQPPRDESLNGLLQGYRIYYRELESEAASAPEAKTLRTPSALRTELAGELSAVRAAGCGRGAPCGERRRPLLPCRCALPPAPLRLRLSPAVTQRRGGPGGWGAPCPARPPAAPAC